MSPGQELQATHIGAVMRRRLNRVVLWRQLWAVIRAALLIGICYLILFPVLSKLSTSFMSRSDLWDTTVSWIPRYATLRNYYLAWEYMRFPVAFWNSFRLSFIVSCLQLVSCTLVGYGLARFSFKGSSILLAFVIFTLVVPPQMIIIPLYLNFRFFNLFGLLSSSVSLVGSLWPFVIVSLTATGFKNGLFVYILRQFFRSMPRDLEEAAYVDGAGFLRTFGVIMLPAAVPALVIVFLFSFVWQWNDYFMISFFMRGQVLLPNMLEGLAEQALTHRFIHAPVESSLLNNTGSLLVIAPLLVLYIAMQRYFVESIERTGLTG